jgi:hypothetical protein
MLGRGSIAAEAAAEGIVDSLLDAESCWTDSLGLPPYPAPRVVAGLEVAFARIGIAKQICRRSQRAATADALCGAIDGFARAAFPDRGDEITDSWYSAPLFDVAPKAIGHYLEAADLPHKVAGRLMERLGASSANAWLAVPMMEACGNAVGDTLRQMRISARFYRKP